MKTPDPRNQGSRATGSRWGRTDNPLSRPSDRLRHWIDLVLLAVLVCGLPVAGMTAGTHAYHLARHHAQTQAAGEHRVTARLTANATYILPGGPGGAVGRAPVRWTDNAGKHVATAATKPGQKKGTYLHMWVDRAGRITTPPESPAVASAAGVGIGVLVASLEASLVVAALAGTRRMLDCWNRAQWEKEWSTVEPLWSHRSDK